MLALLLALMAPGCREEATPVAPNADSAAIDAALDAAAEYLRARDLPKAEAILAVAIERAPRCSEAHEMLGQVLAARAIEEESAGRSDRAAATRLEALACYREAVAQAPESAGLRGSAATIAMTAGRDAEALAGWTEAERLDPHDPRHPLFAAQALLRLDRAAEALAAADRALALAPDEAYAHATRAVALGELGEPGEAVAAVERARALAPADPGIRGQAARVHRRSGAADRGVELLVSMPPRERVAAGLTAELAACWRALGEPAKAAAAWEEEWSIRGGGPAAWRSALEAGRARAESGNRAEAGRWLETLRAIAPERRSEIAELESALASTPEPRP